MDSPNTPAERDPDELLRDADRARDNRDWALAELLYAGFLEHRPEAWGIRVQLGHCRKEQGDAAGALALYREAETAAPEDADLQLQIGHALKLLARLEEAEAAYARAASLDPGFAPARQELIAIRRQIAIAQAMLPATPAPAPAWPFAAPAAPPAPAEAPGERVEAAIVFDVSDLLDHFNSKRTPTGIQRVQSGIVGRLVADATPGIALVAHRQERLDWAEVNPAQFRALLDLSASGADPEEPEWLAAVQAMAVALHRARPHAFSEGAVLVNLGNAFGFAEYFRALRIAMRESGIRFLPFVHDTVPLIVPEHCVAGLVRDYARWFGGFALHATGFLCNSESTRRDVERHLAALVPGLRLEGTVVRLDADPRPDAPPARGALAEIGGLRSGEPFVLFVGTIESRKNHLLVFQAWLQLLRRHGEGAVPRLVCVGKPGWHAEAALNLLKNAPELRRHVLILPAVADGALGALYEACLFTVYNSHYEGWGLPVTESLAHGKVPLVPEHSALPEAGGPGAVYFTSGSEPDLLAKLEALLFDPAYLAEREAAVRSGPPLRSWAELGRQVIGVAERLRDAPPPEPRLFLEPGTPYRPGAQASARPSATAALASAMREGGTWHQPEPWGVWSAGGVAALRLPLPPALRGEAPLRLYLELRAPPGRIELGVRILAPGRGTLRLAESAREPGQIQTLLIALPGGAGAAELSVELDSGEGVRVPSDPRLLGIGLSGLMLCREDDLAARLAYLEADRFRRPLGEG